MTPEHVLHRFLSDSARRRPDHPAIEEPDNGAIAYRNLDLLSDQLRDRLRHFGVRPGDRVGLYLSKSIDAVAAIFGILKTGAVYVPVDPTAPASRNAYILSDCAVKVVIMEKRFDESFRAEFKGSSDLPHLLLLNGTGGGLALQEVLESAQATEPAASEESYDTAADDLAYILYTSGSTGKPKGVMLSHENATSFVNWCSEALDPKGHDRFSSHAPFHFDLSILDVYLAVKHGGTLVLINEEVGKSPGRLAQLISERKISFWYSTPSILSLLAQYGKMENYDNSALRTVLFAGEVFPIKHLRAIKAILPKPRYFNLYGPTETNVCTFFEIPSTIPEERVEPYPIGKACSHVRTKVVHGPGRDARHGQEGELCVTGAGVMQGYWNLPENNGRVFLKDRAGERWYKTGDVVIEDEDGNYLFVGRRDRMVKKRGYRVELGEIESGLYRHPDVEEAAVIALPDDENGVRIKAFLACNGNRPSLIALKGFCAQNLPTYMVPDIFSFQNALPKTSTDKIDYQALKRMV